MMRCLVAGPVVLAGLLVLPVASADSPAQRGQKALLTRTYDPARIPWANYENAWKQWGLDKKPDSADYDQLFRDRYGLHPAPYPNDGLPMGLRKGQLRITRRKGIAFDCMICHGGSIFGQSYVGLGNSSLDFHLLHEELTGSPGRRGRNPFVFSRVRGTSEAVAFAVFLLGFREEDLTVRLPRLELGVRDDMVVDTPAWWLFKKKKTMYQTGNTDTRSVRALMQFMMSPLNGPATFHKAEPDFKDIREYLLSIKAPKYPLSINRQLAAKGEVLFRDNCSRCHGTYGEKWTYPNRMVPLKEIGTDPRRYQGSTKAFGEYYNKGWFSGDYKIRLETGGYQAPPLDGIWATAPYLHNGSVPTLYHLLNSKTRPKLFTRSYRTDRDAYDEDRVGWKVQVLKEAPDPTKTPAHELRKVYDTTQSGRGNGGHTYGDRLSEDERRAVIEYLKTL
jgi:mono/diheme cytochrome c family protein